MRSKRELERLYKAIKAHRASCSVLKEDGRMCSDCHEYTLGVLDYVLEYAGRDKYDGVLSEYENESR